MIRDPSDGTIQEPKEAETSGLPPVKEKTDELVRLEKSREWLKSYFEKDVS